MAGTIITPEDLDKFKLELIEEIRQLLKEQQGTPVKRWLKSYEVLTMLDISKNTLQMMRSRKILKCQKVAGVYYYAMEDIQALLMGKGD